MELKFGILKGLIIGACTPLAMKKATVLEDCRVCLNFRNFYLNDYQSLSVSGHRVKINKGNSYKHDDDNDYKCSRKTTNSSNREQCEDKHFSDIIFNHHTGPMMNVDD